MTEKTDTALDPAVLRYIARSTFRIVSLLWAILIVEMVGLAANILS